MDGVLLAADGLFLPEVLARHALPFPVRVDEFLGSLGTLDNRGDYLDRRALAAHLRDLARRGDVQPVYGMVAAPGS